MGMKIIRTAITLLGEINLKGPPASKLWKEMAVLK